MDSKKWKAKIIKLLHPVCTDYKRYNAIIETLSDILEQRDACLEKYLNDGGAPVIEYTNKAGATNLVKNPQLVIWMDLNTQALSYWRELGLTPAAYRKITGGKPTEEKGSALIEALRAFERD